MDCHVQNNNNENNGNSNDNYNDDNNNNISHTNKILLKRVGKDNYNLLGS